jgi:hypothetical protein
MMVLHLMGEQGLMIYYCLIFYVSMVYIHGRIHHLGLQALQQDVCFAHGHMKLGISETVCNYIRIQLRCNHIRIQLRCHSWRGFVPPVM